LKLPKEKRFKGPASIWKRLFAFLIDLIIIDFVIALPFRRILVNLMPAGGSYSQTFDFLIENPGFTGLLTTITLFIGILSLLYFAILEWKLGQTIGKMFMNVFVVSEKKKMKFWQAIVRSLFVLPVFPFILLWLIDPIVMFFNKDNQRLSEIFSKTKTIQDYTV